MASCCPDKLHYAKGFCNVCYKRNEYKTNTERREIIKRSNRAYAIANPEQTKRNHFKNGIMRAYGLTILELEMLKSKSDDTCYLCARRLKDNNRSIDHDHFSGEVRGILCQKCNLGLGHLGDTIEGLERALDYLKNPPARKYLDEFRGK